MFPSNVLNGAQKNPQNKQQKYDKSRESNIIGSRWILAFHTYLTVVYHRFMPITCADDNRISKES